MDDFSYLRSTGAIQGGEPLTRKMSSSHVMPSKLEDYQNFFRQSSNREEGVLSIRFGRGVDSKWEKKFVIFEDGVLYFASDKSTPLEETHQVPMDTVISVRTDIYESPGTTLIVVSTLLCKIFMKAKTSDESKRWLFCFQKSVALVLLHLLNEKTTFQQDLVLGNVGIGGYDMRKPPLTDFTSSHISGSMSAGKYNSMGSHRVMSPENMKSAAEDAKMWLQELGHGHGKHSAMVRARTSNKEQLKEHDFNTNNSRRVSNYADSSTHSSSDKAGGLVQIPLSHTTSIESHTSTIDLTQVYMRESGEVLFGSKTNSADGRRPSSQFSGLSQSLSSTSQFMSYFNTKNKYESKINDRTDSPPTIMIMHNDIYNSSGQSTSSSVYSNLRQSGLQSPLSSSRSTTSSSASSASAIGNNTNNNNSLNSSRLSSAAIPIRVSAHASIASGSSTGTGINSSGRLKSSSSNNNKRENTTTTQILSHSPEVLNVPVHDPAIDNLGLSNDSFDGYAFASVMGPSQRLAGSYHDEALEKTVLDNSVIEERLKNMANGKEQLVSSMIQNNNNVDTHHGHGHDQHPQRLHSEDRRNNLSESQSNTSDYFMNSFTSGSYNFEQVTSIMESQSQSHANSNNTGYTTTASNSSNINKNSIHKLTSTTKSASSRSTSANTTPRENAESSSVNRSAARNEEYDDDCTHTGTNGGEYDNDDDCYMMFDMDDSVSGRNNNSNSSNNLVDSALKKQSSSSSKYVSTSAATQHTHSINGTQSTSQRSSSHHSNHNTDRQNHQPSFAAVAIDLLDNTQHHNAGSNSSHVNQMYQNMNPLGMSSAAYSASSSSSSAYTPYSPKWESGYCTILGPRSKNEDRLVALPNLFDDISRDDMPVFTPTPSMQVKPSKQAYFAVYDGHCGDEASTYLQRRFHSQVCRHPCYYHNINEAITDTCINIDSEFLKLCASEKINCGTTALGAFLRDDELTVYNIGDCSAVLASSDGTNLMLSDSHKPHPQRSDERARILAANGWITEEQELYMGRLHRMDLTDPLVRDIASQVKFVTLYRVCGDLAVTRSIGDPDYKNVVPGAVVQQWFQWPETHSKTFETDLIIPVPEIMNITLTPRHEFIIFASDGLWDVMSVTDAVLFVKDQFSKHKNKSTSQIAEELCELALRLGSSDNVTVVIVQFLHT